MMNYNEDEIRDQLNQASIKVDTDQLWNDIKHHAPIKRKKKWMPIPFIFFLGGLLIGGLIQFMMQVPCSSDDIVYNYTLDSIKTENENLKNKLRNSIAQVSELEHELVQCDKTQISNKAIAYRSYTNQQNLIVKNKANTTLSITDQNLKKVADATPPVNEIIIRDKQIAAVAQPYSDSLAVLKSTPEVKQYIENKENLVSIPSTKVLKNNNNWQYLVGFYLGTSLVSDRQITTDGNNHHTAFTPYLSYAMEVGATKNVNRRFSIGALLNYSNSIYRFDYINSVVENISLIDTSEIIFETSGATSIISGNTGGTKITETRGKVHGYQQCISIIPIINYQSIYNHKWQLHHHIGLGLDIIHQSRNIIPTYADQNFIIQEVKGFSFTPYLRLGTRLDYLISKDMSASILLKCAYHREQYSFGSTLGTRTTVFPTIGLGLFFK